LPGSLFWGAMYAFAYVAGMIAPLLLIAVFIDKSDFTKKFEKLSNPVSYSIAGKKIKLTIAEMISGVMFLLLGVLILYLAKAGKLAMENNEFQTSVNIFMSNLTDSINTVLANTSLMAGAAVVLALTVAVFVYMRKSAKGKIKGGRKHGKTR